MGPVDLGSLTLDFTSEFEARFADREVTLAIEEPPIGAPVEIEADAHRIAQALRHVLTHAMSAARRSVTVRIEEERSGGVAVVIRDDRPGIPPGELGQLFDPLAQSRRPGNRPGTGLGLPIAREIVSAHHGTITVESTDEATTFYVRLPRRQPGARQDGSAPRENAA
jgi:two-component system OmpR family sensor kinase